MKEVSIVALVIGLLAGCSNFDDYYAGQKRRVWEGKYPPYYEGERVITRSKVAAAGSELKPAPTPKPKPSATPPPLSNTGGSSSQPPTAKFVGDNLVESPFIPGKLIDVSGIPAGSLAKDPYTSREFIVPIK